MKIYLKIIIHSIYWVVFGSFSLAVSMSRQGDDWPLLSNLYPHYFINFIWAGVAFYLFYFYFIRFFERKQFAKYLLFSVLLSVAITWIFLPVHKLFYPLINLSNYNVFIPPMFGTFIIVQTGILVRGFENWFTNIPIKTELENRNLRNELELLKSQINPHFLFNTLNNIDSLIHSSPVNASASLITLSEILRYMIYETRSETVSLQKEITYLKNYISLQNLRFRNPAYINFSVPADCRSINIAPMLFIPLVENAFKFSSDIGKYPVIDILIECGQNNISFSCINYFNGSAIKSGGGLGLSNVKRRLDLLYNNRYDLCIVKENSVFKVELNINL